MEEVQTSLEKTFCTDLIEHALFDEAVKLVKESYKLKVEANQSKTEFKIKANGIELLDLVEELLESWLKSKKANKGNSTEDRIKAADANPLLDISDGRVVWVFWGNLASKLISTVTYTKLVKELKGPSVDIIHDKKAQTLHITCKSEVFKDVKKKVENVKTLITLGQDGLDKSQKSDSKNSTHIDASKTKGSKDSKESEIKGNDSKGDSHLETKVENVKTLITSGQDGLDKSHKSDSKKSSQIDDSKSKGSKDGKEAETPVTDGKSTSHLESTATSLISLSKMEEAQTSLKETFCKDLIQHRLFDEAVKLVKESYKLKVEANQSKTEFKIKANGIELLDFVEELLESWLERKKAKKGNSTEDRIKAADANPLLDISDGRVVWVFWGNLASKLISTVTYTKLVKELKGPSVDIIHDKKAQTLHITCKSEVFKDVKKKVENVKTLITLGQDGLDKSQKSDSKNSTHIDASKTKGSKDSKESEIKGNDSKGDSHLETKVENVKTLITSGQDGLDKSHKSDSKKSSQIDDSKSKGSKDGKEAETPVTDGKSTSHLESTATSLISLSKMEEAQTSLKETFCKDLIQHTLFDEAVKLVKESYKLKVEANQSKTEFKIKANGIELLYLVEELLESWLERKKANKGNSTEDRIKAADANPLLDISDGRVVWVFWGDLASKLISTGTYTKLVKELKGPSVDIKHDKKAQTLHITCKSEVFKDVKKKVENMETLITLGQDGLDKSQKSDSKNSTHIDASKTKGSKGSKESEIKGNDSKGDSHLETKVENVKTPMTFSQAGSDKPQKSDIKDSSHINGSKSENNKDSKKSETKENDSKDHSKSDLLVSKQSDVCGTTVEPFTGNQPTGIMYHHVRKDIHLPGFESYGTIEIFYEFPDGSQGIDHPNPGKPYKGIKRKAFLPDSIEGQKVLQLLKVAFDRKLVFTVGDSLTTGMTDVITWSGIEHKTKVTGGPSRYGYPDGVYLSRVQAELALSGVTEKDIQDADDTPDALDRSMKVERKKEENVQSRCKQEQRKQPDKEGELLLFAGTVSVERPKYWTEMKNTEILKVVTLDISDPDYTNVVQEFHRSSGSQRPVVKVERIQNLTLYSQYIVKKRQLEIQNSHNNNEIILWHGTTPDALDSINTHGFNRSYCGKNAASYGNGVYFAVNASYSVKGTYSTPDSHGHKRMYQCRVLVGDYTQGKSGMKVPPPKSATQTHILYDSVVDKPNNPSMFVIFHDVQAYPSYLITFH